MAKKKKLGKQMVTIKAGNVRIHVRGRTKRIAQIMDKIACCVVTHGMLRP